MQQQHQQWMQPQQSGYAAQSASHSNSWSQQPSQQQRQQLQQQQLNCQQIAKSELQSLVQQLTPQQREHLSKMPPDKRMQFFHNLRNQMARAQQQQLQQQQQQMSQQGSWQQQPSGPQQTGLMHQPGLASQPQVCSTHVLLTCFVWLVHAIKGSIVAYSDQCRTYLDVLRRCHASKHVQCYTTHTEHTWALT